MDLEKPTRDVLKRDSIAAIKSEGLVGDKYIEISFGSGGADPLRDGDTIASEPPVDIANLVKKTDQILDSAKTAVSDLDGTASNLKSISAKIDQGKGTVGALINDKTVYPDEATLKRLFVMTARDPATQRIINRLWTRVKTGH